LAKKLSFDNQSVNILRR